MSIRSVVVAARPGGPELRRRQPAQADGADRAADACIQAFVDAYLPKDRLVSVRTLSPAPGPLGAYRETPHARL